MNTKPKPSKEFIKTRVSACLNQMRIATDPEQVDAFKMEVKGWIETATMAYGFASMLAAVLPSWLLQ